MYDYLDRPVASLDEGSRFLVWSMRGWTQSLTERRCPPPVLAPGFAVNDLDAMLPHFHMAMMTLNRDGRITLRFGAMDSGRVSEGEAILLSLVRLLAADRLAAATDTVALLVKAEAAVVLRRALATVAILLSARFPVTICRPGARGGDSGTINGGKNPRVDDR